jgi:riboflavin synthase
MFTGIVEELGLVARLQQRSGQSLLDVEARRVLAGSQLGDSIAVNGVCLTVTALRAQGFTAGVSLETLRRSNLGTLHSGVRVHLERALTPTSRMGGHFVQGHIDGIATLRKMEKDGDSQALTFSCADSLTQWMVPKGFVALDGASLTLTDVQDESFSVMLVPYTQTQLTLSHLLPGGTVNVEVDLLAKYVAKSLARSVTDRQKEPVNHDFLRAHGFGW